MAVATGEGPADAGGPAADPLPEAAARRRRVPPAATYSQASDLFGPAIVEQDDTTTLVPAGFRAATSIRSATS